MRWNERASGERRAKARCAPGVFVALGLGVAMVTAPAAAQPKGPGPAASAVAATKAAKIDLAALSAQLAAPETLAAGLAVVQGAGPKAKTLAPRIEELLAKGLPGDLAISAMRALGAIGAASSSAAIAPYVQHRSADVRKAAAEALAKARGPDAAAALRKGLRSSDAAVRSLSASGLAVAGDKESVPDLVRALDRGIAEAAPSVGALCIGAQCDDLLARLDKVTPAAARSVLEAMLQRKPALGDDVLVAAVKKVAAVSSSDAASAKAYFSSLSKGFKGSKKVQKALDAAAHAPKESKP